MILDVAPLQVSPPFSSLPFKVQTLIGPFLQGFSLWQSLQIVTASAHARMLLNGFNGFNTPFLNSINTKINQTTQGNKGVTRNFKPHLNGELIRQNYIQ